MNPFTGGKCGKCGNIMMIRPDNLPLCSECEKKMTEFYAKKNHKSKKQVLHSEAETEQDAE